MSSYRCISPSHITQEYKISENRNKCTVQSFAHQNAHLLYFKVISNVSIDFVALAQPACLSVRFHEREDVVLSARALDVADDCAAALLHGAVLSEEAHAHLRDATAAAGAAEDLHDLREAGVVVS